MEDKYIELILKGCLKVKKNTPLFINYNKLNQDFVIKIVKYAQKLGLRDIYLDEIDFYETHDVLKKCNIAEIKKHELFNCSVWDEYAKKRGAFLMLESEIPNLMNDIEADKIEASAKAKTLSKPLYKKMQLNSEIPWCIACVPNELWAKDLFPKSKDALKEFWKTLGKICYLDKDDPILEWNTILKKRKIMQKKLNSLNITKLHYTNSLGTDLTVTLPENALWESAESPKGIVNIPSFEIFTTPNYRLTEGIVYASKPLIYGGKVINDFYIKFVEGKAVSFDAKEGKDILKGIINSDKLSSFLGEVALVNYNSPISKTNLVFKSTLIDENASCHIALGSGFLECVKGSEKMNDKERDKVGINSSKNHVDFMIGTKDLKIEAETKKGAVVIMKNGNLVL